MRGSGGVVGELTDDRTFQFAEINRVGRTDFEILVRTTDTQDLKIRGIENGANRDVTEAGGHSQACGLFLLIDSSAIYGGGCAV